MNSREALGFAIDELLDRYHRARAYDNDTSQLTQAIRTLGALPEAIDGMTLQRDRARGQ